MTGLEWMGEVDNSIVKLFEYIFKHDKQNYPHFDLEKLAEITVCTAIEVSFNQLTPQQQKTFCSEMKAKLTAWESFIDKD